MFSAARWNYLSANTSTTGLEESNYPIKSKLDNKPIILEKLLGYQFGGQLDKRLIANAYHREMVEKIDDLDEQKP